MVARKRSPSAAKGIRMLHSKYRRRLRTLLWEAQSGICALCGNYMGLDEVTLDHIVPVAEGGKNTTRNLRATHAHCNSTRDTIEVRACPVTRVRQDPTCRLVLQELQRFCNQPFANKLTYTHEAAGRLSDYISALELRQEGHLETVALLHRTQEALLDALTVFAISRSTNYWKSYKDVIEQAQSQESKGHG